VVAWLPPAAAVVLEEGDCTIPVAGSCPRTVAEVGAVVPRVVYRSYGTLEEHR
jgi:hypothetical protein